MTSTFAITIFVVGIVVAIMLHEWGHFITARRFGMRADRFFLGFGPTLWSRRVGETEYGVKALPLGGFVRIRGMSPLDRRRRPLVDEVLDPDALAADRRAAAERTGVDVLEQPALPEESFGRLDEALRERGASKELRDRVVRRVRDNLAEDATAADARLTLSRVLAGEVADTGRHGDLHHRLFRGDEGRFFSDRPAWQRAIVLVAGSAMHFVIAVGLLFVGYSLLPQTTGEVAPVVSDVVPGSVAEDIGLEAGDRITAVDGQAVEDFATVREAIRANPGTPIALTVDRGGQTQQLEATPEPTTDGGERVGQLGFFPTPVTERLSAGAVLRETFVGDASITTLTVETFKAMGRVFGPEGLGNLVGQIGGGADRDVSGAISLVGAAGATGQGTAQYGVMFLILMLASINVFVGIFNILPLPPLDGGHLAVLAVERSVNAVRRARGRAADFSIDPRAVAAIAIPVIAIFGTLTVALLWLDITNPVQLP